jgi:hypothetical protein
VIEKKRFKCIFLGGADPVAKLLGEKESESGEKVALFLKIVFVGQFVFVTGEELLLSLAQS